MLYVLYSIKQHWTRNWKDKVRYLDKYVEYKHRKNLSTPNHRIILESLLHFLHILCGGQTNEKTQSRTVHPRQHAESALPQLHPNSSTWVLMYSVYCSAEFIYNVHQPNEKSAPSFHTYPELNSFDHVSTYSINEKQ